MNVKNKKIKNKEEATNLTLWFTYFLPTIHIQSLINMTTATYDVEFGSNDAVTQVDKEIEIKTKTSS
jgi:hypothetical protein